VLYLLSLYNSLSLKLEPFETLEAKKVKMYTCGPSTYQRPHIGNYRTFLFEDILQRYLEFLGYNVTRLIALTNVEDKALAQAKKDGLSVEELTSRNEDTFFKELKLLHIKQPDYMVRASDIIDQAVILINHLMTKGIAYKSHYKGAENIYFNPLKFPSFGKLAHLDMNNLAKKTKRRFHKDTYPGMPWNKGDFILLAWCKINEKNIVGIHQ
jgi:cysteinyl-tRNA synthetase